MTESEWVDRERLLLAALQRLECLQGFGVRQLGRPKPMKLTIVPAVPVAAVESIATLEAAGPLPASAAAEVRQPTTPAVATAANPPAAEPPAIVGSKTQALAILRQEVAQCELCRELAGTRKQTVFGVGNPNARLCFFGEAPGADEDHQGEPFVGAAGQLLNKMIAACTLRREDVFILNVLKCRPPGNRTPQPEEIANCRPFFERQLELIQPEFICCLGAVAAQSLLQTTLSVGRLRGKLHRYKNSKVIATYHPAYLLRYPEMKRPAWEDLQLLMREMGLSPAGPR